MSMRIFWQGGFVALAFAASAVIAPVGAATVHGTSTGITLTDNRSLQMNELEVDPTGDPKPGQVPTSLSIDWAIVDISPGLGISLWSYKYTIDWDPTSASDISHLVLNLSAGCDTDMACVQTPKINGSNPADTSFGTFIAPSGNPNLDAPIFGVKFDVSNGTGGDPFTVEFSSNRAPVWGDIYLKAGKWSANNLGLADPHTSSNVMDFIARPNGTGTPTCPGGGTFPNCSQQQVSTPEPMSLGLLGMGLLGLAGVRMRRRARG